MSKKRKPTPSHSEITQAHLEWLQTTERFKFDGFEEIEACCWACGLLLVDDKNTPKTEKAHIVPHCEGGTNNPENYFLLCHACHREQPDGALIEDQKFWLESHEDFWEISLWERRYPVFYKWFPGWLKSLNEESLSMLCARYSNEGFQEAIRKGDDSSAANRTDTMRANRSITMKKYYESLVE